MQTGCVSTELLEDLDDSSSNRSDNPPRFRNDWNSGRHGHRRSYPGNVNADAVRRVMNAGSPGSGASPVSCASYGLAVGETWMRVSVLHGAMMSLDFLKENFGAALGIPIRIYNPITRGQGLIFFFKMRAKKIGVCRKEISSIINPNTGSPIICDVNPCREPEVPHPGDSDTSGDSGSVRGNNDALLPPVWIDALRECFKERFQTTTRVLDLSNLHTDLTLLNKGLYIPLDKATVFASFLAILQENKAQILALNLSNNRLRHVQPFEDMINTLGAPDYSVERLDLSSNAITHVRNLEPLGKVPGLCHLDITDTPLAGRLSNPNYTKQMEAQIVRIMPGLKTLNGKPITVTVEFAIERASSNKAQPRTPRFPLPTSIQGYFPSDDVRIPLLTFLKEYFTLYDRNPRGESIYACYTPVSTLTMCLNPASQFSGKSVSEAIESTNPSSLAKEKVLLMTNNLDDAYFKQNRNLLRCKDEHRRHELICQGPLNICSALGKLPPTEHILESFCVDVVFHSDSQILFNVSGVFFELKPGTGSVTRKILRCFSRSIILVAPGCQILQDDLVISNPSESLIQRYIRDVKKMSLNPTSNTAIAMNNSSSAPASGSYVQPSVGVGGDNLDVMLLEFRRQTGMNAVFSRQCLEEFQWRFDTALSSFQAMHAAGKIPSTAFAPD